MPDFRFRLPAIVDLTFAQQIAFDERKKSLLVTGGPGSGKTVVSIYRYQREIMEKNDTIFFTYHRTLIAAIRGTFRQQADVLMPGLSDVEVEKLLDNTVSSFSSWYHKQFKAYLPDETDEAIIENIKSIENPDFYNYEEIFIDEAQDLRPVVLDAMILLSARLTCGADRAQDLNGHYIEPADEYIKKLLIDQGKSVTHQGLTQNFRNTRQIFEFARKFVPEDLGVQEIDTTELNDGENPELILLPKWEQLNLIVQIIKDNPNSNIGILVHSFPQINDIRDHLIKNDFSCEAEAEDANSFSYYYVNKSMNRDHRDIMETKLRSPFIITFDSCKGLEFDIVIMPFFDSSNWAMSNYKTKGDTEEPDTFANGEIKYYASRNHYYVACTRARGQLYIMYSYKPNILSFYDENTGNNNQDDLPF